MITQVKVGQKLWALDGVGHRAIGLVVSEAYTDRHNRLWVTIRRADTKEFYYEGYLPMATLIGSKREVHRMQKKNAKIGVEMIEQNIKVLRKLKTEYDRIVKSKSLVV